MFTQLIMPEEKKIIDKLLPKDGSDLSEENCGLWIDPIKNEIVATDSFVMLTLSIPQVEDNPSVADFINYSFLEEQDTYPLHKCIRIDPRYARMHEIGALRVNHGLATADMDMTETKKKKNTEPHQPIPVGLDIMDEHGKITIYAFQVGANPPVLKEFPKQTNLFGEELEMTSMYANKAKISFDKLLIELGGMTYQIGESLTYATGTTKNGYQFHLMVRTPKFKNNIK